MFSLERQMSENYLSISDLLLSSTSLFLLLLTLFVCVLSSSLSCFVPSLFLFVLSFLHPSPLPSWSTYWTVLMKRIAEGREKCNTQGKVQEPTKSSTPRTPLYDPRPMMERHTNLDWPKTFA